MMPMQTQGAMETYDRNVGGGMEHSHGHSKDLRMLNLLLKGKKGYAKTTMPSLQGAIVTLTGPINSLMGK